MTLFLWWSIENKQKTTQIHHHYQHCHHHPHRPKCCRGRLLNSVRMNPKTVLVFILLCRDPLLCNNSVNTFPWEPMCATIGHLLLGNGSVNTPKPIRDDRRWRFPWGLPRGYITWSSKEAVVVRSRESSVEEEFALIIVKNWVEFWRWQLKVIEKKCQERN
jgi:hypothetical protein